MEHKTIINEDNEEVIVPIINIGDIVDITMDSRDDGDLFHWLESYKGLLIVKSIDYNSYMIWLKNCEYGVSMEFVSNIEEGFY